jgi:trk system potassium uptake protein TrkA
LLEVHLHEGWFGQPATKIEGATGARLAFITRLGKGVLPDEHTVLQEGDLVHLLVMGDKREIVELTLAQSPGGK